MDGIYAGGSAGSEEARVAAMAEGVRALRHALNNPLTALLAEAQMLEMEAPTPEVRAAAERIIALCRRMSSITKEADPRRGGRAPDACAPGGPEQHCKDEVGPG